MKRLAGLIGIGSVCLLALAAGCGDGSNNNNGGGNPDPGPGPEPEPEVSLDETGIYSGTVETDDGDVALMTLLLARDGTTAFSLQTDDSERATIVLWGESDGADGVLSFSGIDTADDRDVTLDIQVDDNTASGRIELPQLAGSYSLHVEDFSDRQSSLTLLSGVYARQDALSGLSQISISDDGSVTFSGDCDAEGNAEQIDPGINLYRLSLEGDCIALDALVSLQDVEQQGDVFALTGDAGDSGVAVEFFRL